MDSAAAQPRRYKLIKPKVSRHYDVKVDDGSNGKNRPAVFVVDISNFTPGKADLTMHAGSDLKTNPPAVACSHFPSIGRSFKLGIGDPGNAAAMAWEEIKREGLRGGQFSWAMDMPGSGERVPLVWKRTSSVAVDGMSASHLSSRDWKLVDPQGSVLAVFTHQMGLTTCGTLQINADFGSRFDHAVLMTLITLHEYSRRRRNAAAASGGGGGGGGG